MLVRMYSKKYLRASLVKRLKPLLMERLKLHQLHKKFLEEAVNVFPTLKGRSVNINNWVRLHYKNNIGTKL